MLHDGQWPIRRESIKTLYYRHSKNAGVSGIGEANQQLRQEDLSLIAKDYNTLIGWTTWIPQEANNALSALLIDGLNKYGTKDMAEYFLYYASLFHAAEQWADAHGYKVSLTNTRTEIHDGWLHETIYEGQKYILEKK